MNRNSFDMLRSLALTFVASGLLALAGCGGASTGGPSAGSPTTAVPVTSPSPATIDCNTAQPDDIVNAVYNAIERTKAYTREEWQFNVWVVATGSKKTVKVTGWSGQRDNIFKVVTDTAVNCMPEGDNFVTSKAQLSPQYRTTVSCAPNHFACGDVCLPNGEICRLTGASAEITPPANSNSAVNSNTNINTNSKANAAPPNSNVR